MRVATPSTWLCASLCVCAASLATNNVRAAPETVLVLPPVVSGTSSGNGGGAVVRALTDEVKRVSRRFAGTGVLLPAQLKRKLGVNPVQATGRCASDTACLARLGARVGATTVLFARAKARRGGVRFKLHAVDAATGVVTRRLTFDAASVTQLRAVLENKATTLFAGPASAGPRDEVAGTIDGDPLGDMLSLAPLPGTGEAGQQSDVAALQEGASDGSETNATDPSDREMLVYAEDSSGDPSDADGLAESDPELGGLPLAALDSRQSDPTAQHVSVHAPSSLWLYSGLGFAGAGAAVFGVGAYFGIQAKSLSRVDSGATQIAVYDQQKNQNRAATLGTSLMIAGGAVVAIGVATALVDLANLPQDTAFSVAPLPRGAQVSWRGSF